MERHKGGRSGVLPTTVSSYIHWNRFLGYPETLRSLEMHSKRHDKICTCSVILRELLSLRNYKGFSIILQKILDAI